MITWPVEKESFFFFSVLAKGNQITGTARALVTFSRHVKVGDISFRRRDDWVTIVLAGRILSNKPRSHVDLVNSIVLHRAETSVTQGNAGTNFQGKRTAQSNISIAPIVVGL